MIHSEGYETSLKILSVCQYLLTLAYSEKIGNTSDGDTQLRRSPPGIVCEPILPTPVVMRTDGTRWARRRQNLSASSEPREVPQRIADASGPSRFDAEIGLPHPPTALNRARPAFARTVAGGGKRRRTALTRRARSPLAASRQALLAKRTLVTIGLVGQIDSTLS